MADLVSFADFSKIQLRVGTVEKVEVPAGSAHVYRLTVNLGSAPKIRQGADTGQAKQNGSGKRTIFAGLKQTHEVKDLLGKQGIFVVNLEPKKMMGEESQGMMLAVCGERDEPVLIVPEKKVEEGSVVR